MIGIIDYGAGNLRSVKKALSYLGADSFFIKNRDDMKNADGIILPGVGAFGKAAEKIEPFREDILDSINSGIPFLGICLGMQMLFENSEESPRIRGLEIFKGYSKKFKGCKVPQIGWNSINISKKRDAVVDISNGTYVYFLHGYYVIPDDKNIIMTKTTYGGIEYASSVGEKNVDAFQFHPEKSGDEGIKMLNNWVIACRQ